ncbi:MAG: hypothetical protein ACYDBY_16620 [Thermoanaerobaculia bacterium]
MKRQDAVSPVLLATAALALAAAAARVDAQGTFRLVVDAVAEARHRSASNETEGRLTLQPKLEGEGLSDAKAFRLRLAAAVDATGRDILPEELEPSRWEERPSGPGLWIVLASPARGAASVTVSGTIELWIPSRDAGAEVTIPRALARPGAALAAPALRSAGITLRVAPRGESAPTVVSLRGRSSDVERVRNVRVLRADGTELATSGLQVTTAAEKGSLELLLAEPPPADATLVLGLLTKRSVVVVPFELKEVALP